MSKPNVLLVHLGGSKYQVIRLLRIAKSWPSAPSTGIWQSPRSLYLFSYLRLCVLVCVDHWPGRLIGKLGHPVILTPTLNQLANNGVIYTNAYSTTPVCIAARRELHTGAFSPTHGDRNFDETAPMPDLPTLAQTFLAAGYQTRAVGKLHVYPQRDRIGFEEVILDEEGRHHLGMQADDYELFLAEAGYAGQELTHGMGNNDYCARPWHLPEYYHSTNWAVREMNRVIRRRDVDRPAFWYLSFRHPHPPLVPLSTYLDIYRGLEIDRPYFGEWAASFENLPYALKARRLDPDQYNANEIKLARQAFYAQCTHIDHQLRLVIGILNEEGLLDDTIILFTGDHGDMLGNHGLYAKALFYEESAKIPMILMPTATYDRLDHHQIDERLVTLGDVMPTLLDLCDIPIPETVEGTSLLTPLSRDYLYGEQWDAPLASRMLHDGRYKLIYYPVGNHSQLFDLESDPNELHNLAGNPAFEPVQTRLTQQLIQNLYGEDQMWLENGRLVGLPDIAWQPQPDRSLGGQRGWRFM